MKPEIIRLDPSFPVLAWPDFPETEISSGARSSKGHLWLADKNSGLSVGLWESEANTGRWMNWPVCEFMVVVEGEVVLIEENRETVVGPGECFFIPKGRRCIWNQSGYFKKIMVMFDDSAGFVSKSSDSIFKIDPTVELIPAEPPPADALISPSPIQQIHSYFDGTTSQFDVGVWQTTSCEGKFANAFFNEVMHILEGELTLTDEKGRRQTFSNGDTVFVPMGTPHSWKTKGLLRKIYCKIAPKK